MSSQRAIDELYSKLTTFNGVITQEVAANTPAAATAGPKWVLSENPQYQCSYCDDQNEATIYIRCGHHRQGKYCSKYLHIDCGINIESFYLDDDGNLTCECNSHFQPIIFCSCKKPYDDKLPMIQCDHCLEWYHNQCEGLTGKEVENDDYVCKSCRSLASKGKSISQEIKTMNSEKDERYRFNTDGNAAAELLWRLVDDVCPVVDGVLRQSSANDGSMETIATAIVTIQDCVMIPEDDNESRIGRVVKDGEFLEAWNRQLMDFQSAFQTWQQLAMDALDTFLTNFSGSFSIADKELFNRVFQQFSDLEFTRSSKFHYIGEEVQGYLIVYEILQHIKLFFNGLYAGSENAIEQQIKHLATSREATFNRTLRLDKLSREMKSDSFAAKHSLFSKFCKDAKTLLNNIDHWYGECHKLLNFQGHWTNEKFTELLKFGKEKLPIHFKDELLALEELASKIKNFEIAVDEILSKPVFDEQLVNALQTEKNEIPVETESNKLLDMLTVYGVLSKAYGIFCSGETRPRRDAIEKNVLQEGNSLMNILQSIEGNSPLVHHLLGKTSEIVQSITSLLQQVDTTISSIPTPVLMGHQRDVSVNERLQALPILTLEEELVKVHQDVLDLQEKVESFVARTTPLELDTLINMVDDLNTAYETCDRIERALKQNSYTDLPNSTNEKKRTLRGCITKVISLKDSAAKTWNVLKSQSVKLQSGEYVDLSEMIKSYEEAQRLLIIDTELDKKISELIEQGKIANEICIQRLDGLQSTNNASLEEVSKLFNEMKNVAIYQKTRFALNVRYHAVKTIDMIRHIVHEFSSTIADKQEENEIANIPDAFTERIREVSKELMKLESTTRQHNYAYEASMLMGPKQVFAPIEWKVQVSSLLNTPNPASIPFAKAQELVEHAKAMFLSHDESRRQIERPFANLQEKINTFAHYRGEAMDMFQSLSLQMEPLLSSTSDSQQMVASARNLQLLERIPVLIDMATSFQDTFLAPLHSKVKLLRDFFRSTMLTDDIAQQVIVLDTFLQWIQEGNRMLQVMQTSRNNFVDFIQKFGLGDLAVALKQCTSASFPHPMIQLAQIAEMMKNAQQQHQNHQKSLLSYFDLPFVKAFQGFLEDLYQSATAWHQESQVVFPLKVSSRNKSKLSTSGVAGGSGGSIRSREEILRFLTQPSAVLAVTPSHERVMNMFIEIESLTEQLRSFVFSSTSATGSDGQRLINSDVISADLREATALRTTLEALPSDSTEVMVIQWIFSVLLWMSRSSIDPDLKATQNDISLNEARILLAEGVQLLRNFLIITDPSSSLPSGQFIAVESFLRDFQILNDNGQVGTEGMNFSETAGITISEKVKRYSLKRSEHYLNFLDKEVRQAEALQQRIDGMMKKITSSDIALSEMKAFQTNIEEEMKKMVVIPDFNPLVRAIQRKEQQPKEKKVSNASPRVSSAVAPVPPPPPVVVAPKKCAMNGCDKEVKSQFGSYCSDRCTVNCSKDCVMALLKYRDSLKKHHSTSAATATATSAGNDKIVGSKPTVSQRIAADISSFGFHNDVQEEKKNGPHQNFLTSSIDTAQLKQILDKIESKRQQQSGSGTKRNVISAFEQLAIRLPKVATSNGLLREALSGNSGGMITTDDFRSKVRTVLEDWFVPILQQMNYSGAIPFMSILLAKGLEEELFLKYFVEEKDALDRDRYRSQQQMLMTNLRQAHNFHYIQKLIDRELEMEELLKMTAQNFADVRTQQQRQELKQSMLEASRRESTENAMEAKRIAAMSNNESWRDKTVSDGKVGMPALPTHVNEVLPEADSNTAALTIDVGEGIGDDAMDMDYVDGDAYFEDDTAAGDGQGTTGESSSGGEDNEGDDGLLEIERQALYPTKEPSPTRQLKRPFDSNLGSRFTHQNLGITPTDPPPKIQKVESTFSSGAGNVTPSPLPSPMDGKSPSKPVSFLDILKKQKQESGTPVGSASVAKAVSSSSQPPSSPSVTREPRYRLLSRENGHVFTITKPHSIVMKCTAMISETRLQGLVKTDFNIDGRTRIAEVERFTQELVASGRRVVGTAVFLVSDANSMPNAVPSKGDTSGSYRRFCDEFTKDQRAGMCTISDSIHVYLVPPAMKSNVSLLRGLTLSGESKLASMGLGVIWAIIESRERGPEAFTSDVLNKTLPFDVDSFVPPPVVAAAAAPSALPFVPQTLMGAGILPSMVAPTAFGNVAPPINQMRSAFPIGNAPPVAQFAAPVSPVLDLPRIRQVAEDIARSGVAALQSAQNQPNAKQTMPFLFSGNPGYAEFMSALKSAVERNKLAKSMQVPNAFAGPSAFR